MKIIQQDLKVASKLWFVISLFCVYAMMRGLSEQTSNNIGEVIFNLLACGATVFPAYGIYAFSFAYEFKQKEVIVCSLFGLLGRKSYPFKDLKKIKLRLKGNNMDEIALYFESGISKKKISINTLHVDLGKLRLFLFANVENFDELVEEE